MPQHVRSARRSLRLCGHLVDVLKDNSIEAGIAFPAFFGDQNGSFRGLCHGDDSCVVANLKQRQAFGAVLAKKLEVKRTGHTRFPSEVAKEIVILSQVVSAKGVDASTC